MPWAASRFNVTVPLRNGRALVYNALSQAVAIWEPHEVAAFAAALDGAPNTDEQSVKSLSFGGYLVEEGVDEVDVLRKEYDAYRYATDTLRLTIAPTMACNFGCDYCFQGQDKPSDTMTPAVQDAIVDLVRRARVKRVSIAWYGGEPLTRLRVIEELSDRILAVCKERHLGYQANIVTNGYLLTADAARSLRAHGIYHAQVTLDGTPEYHDARRYLLSGKGTFEKILDNLQAVIAADVDLSIVIRVNIDERNHRDIHALIDELARRGLARQKRLKMYFAAIESLTEGCHSVAGVTMTKSDYGQLEAELYRHAWEAGLSGLAFPPRFSGICNAVRPGTLVIIPNGDLHKCWDTVSWPHKKIGSIFALDALADNPLTRAWMTWTPFDNATCKNCKLLPVCSGGCGYKFIHAGDGLGETGTLPCPSWKFNIKERLLLRAVGYGHIAADDYDPAEARTRPEELCADVLLPGAPVPEAMQQAYEQQRRRLRVIA